MGLWARLAAGVRAATQSDGPGKSITTSEDLERALRTGLVGSSAGVAVTPDSAMQVAAVFACVRIISGAVANLPFHVHRRIDDRTREVLANHPVRQLIQRRPNRWQTPSQFRRMLQAHVLLRGNGYARIVWSRGKPIDLLPLHPDRVTPRHLPNQSVVYDYIHPNGARMTFTSREIMHLVGLSLDGVRGVSVITYARETIGLAIAQERHGSTTFKNQALPSLVLSHPHQLGQDGQALLRSSLDEYRSGGDREGSALILEEGMKVDKISMSPQDAQWMQSRSLSRSDIAMFFGVPPHMIGDTEKSTSWGTGIEQQSIGFVTYALEDHLTCWEETIQRDLMSDEPEEVYGRLNRRALLRGDSKARKDYYQSGLQWGWLSPNDVRGLEDMNPRTDGDIYYPPPNMTRDPGDPGGAGNPQEQGDDT